MSGRKRRMTKEDELKEKERVRTWEKMNEDARLKASVIGLPESQVIRKICADVIRHKLSEAQDLIDAINAAGSQGNSLDGIFEDDFWKVAAEYRHPGLESSKATERIESLILNNENMTSVVEFVNVVAEKMCPILEMLENE